MKKLIAVGATVAILAVGCSTEDPTACEDLDKMGTAIQRVDVQREQVKVELLEDIAEAKTEYSCPGYDGWGEGAADE